MPAGHGLRSRTRDLFARPFRKKGYIALTTYLRTYKIGDYVDIKVNGAVHKGMPHKFYHGRTGRVWNVTKRAIGVEINKQVLLRLLSLLIDFVCGCFIRSVLVRSIFFFFFVFNLLRFLECLWIWLFRTWIVFDFYDDSFSYRMECDVIDSVRIVCLWLLFLFWACWTYSANFSSNSFGGCLLNFVCGFWWPNHYIFVWCSWKFIRCSTCMRIIAYLTSL